MNLSAVDFIYFLYCINTKNLLLDMFSILYCTLFICIDSGRTYKDVLGRGTMLWSSCFRTDWWISEQSRVWTHIDKLSRFIPRSSTKQRRQGQNKELNIDIILVSLSFTWIKASLPLSNKQQIKTAAFLWIFSILEFSDWNKSEKSINDKYALINDDEVHYSCV